MAVPTTLPYLFIWMGPFLENCGSHTGPLRANEAYTAKGASVPHAFGDANIGYRLTHLVSDRMQSYLFHSKISWIYLLGGSRLWYCSKSVVLNQERFWVPGDIWPHLETLLVSTSGEVGGTGIRGRGPRMLLSLFHCTGQPFTTENYLVKGQRTWGWETLE